MYSINICQFYFPSNKEKLFFHYEKAEWFPTAGDITISWQQVSICKYGGGDIFIVIMMGVGLLAFGKDQGP